MDNKELPPLDNNGKPVPATATKGGKAAKSSAEFVIEPDTDAQAPEQSAELKPEQQSEQAESKQSETENTRNNSKENDR